MNALSRPIRVLFGGGGTGGHLFPGIAVAQELTARNGDHEVLFVTTGKPFERAALERVGFPLAVITAEGIKGRRIFEKLSAAAKIPKGLAASIRVIHRFKPHVVAGLGSYTAGVVVLAGWVLGKPIVLFEQNRLPGMTNRMLFPLADRIYVSFPGTRERMTHSRVLYTGNPVRRSVLAVDDAPVREDRPFTILVIGGSQGAHAVNVAVTQALDSLTEKSRFHFIHQTGPADAHWVRQVYAASGVSGTVAPFFDDMENRYAAADLVICRSGATTVAELTALGKPAVFVPFPFAADDHQTRNARELADAGAAEMIPQIMLDGKMLAEKIVYYAGRPEALSRMARRAKDFGRPDAARVIVDDMTALAEARRKRTRFRWKQKD